MKTVLFDMWALQYGMLGTDDTNSIGGAAEYCKTILKYLIEREKTFDVLIFENYKLSNEFEDIIDSAISEVHRVYARNFHDLSKIISRYDVFFSALPYFYWGLDFPRNTKFIYTIHGLRDIEKNWDTYYLSYQGHSLKQLLKAVEHYFFPRHKKKRHLKKMQRLVDVTDNRMIICVSNHTKYSVLANLSNVSSQEIYVFYSPQKIISPIIQFDEKKHTCDKSNEKYILLTRGDHWIKNDLRACIAIDELLSEGKLHYKVIIVGVGNEKIYTDRIVNLDSFEFRGYVPSDELESLYQNAELFIFPSLNEGFGYPPIECMKYGTRTICAADSSIMEICGGEVLYFNPYDVEEIKTRIIQCLDTEEQDYCEAMKNRATYINNRQDRDLDELIKVIFS